MIEKAGWLVGSHQGNESEEKEVGKTCEGQKNQGRKVKDGEKGSCRRSAMEKYEWVLGVCILDWGRPLSDRERCECSQWWFITRIGGSSQEVDGPASRYVSILPMSIPTFSSLLHLHLDTCSGGGGRGGWKQQIWGLAVVSWMVTDEDGALVRPNYQEAAPQQRPCSPACLQSWCSSCSFISPASAPWAQDGYL